MPPKKAAPDEAKGAEEAAKTAKTAKTTKTTNTANTAKTAKAVKQSLRGSLEAIDAFLGDADRRKALLGAADGGPYDRFVCVQWAGSGGNPSFSLRALLSKVRRFVAEAIADSEETEGRFAALLKSTRRFNGGSGVPARDAVMMCADMAAGVDGGDQEKLEAWVVTLASALLPTDDATSRVCSFEDCLEVLGETEEQKNRKKLRNEVNAAGARAKRAAEEKFKGADLEAFNSAVAKAETRARQKKAKELHKAAPKPVKVAWRDMDDDRKAEALLGKPHSLERQRSRCDEHRFAQITAIERGNVAPWIVAVADGRDLPRTMPYRCCRPRGDDPRKLWRDYLRSDMFADLKANRLCRICKNELAPGRIHIDHDHTCPDGPSVRGLLCEACNTTEGKTVRAVFDMTKVGEDATAAAVERSDRTYTDAYVAFVDKLLELGPATTNSYLSNLGAYLNSYRDAIAGAEWADP